MRGQVHFSPQTGAIIAQNQIAAMMSANRRDQ
jgi:hypothetical protein